MRGPDGKTYPNEIVVTGFDPNSLIRIHHVSAPRYFLTVTFEAVDDGGTRVTWEQEFENPDVGRGMAHIVGPANKQLLARLTHDVLTNGT